MVRPCAMNRRQSSAVWFQPTLLESASAPGTSACVSAAWTSASVAPIAHLEFGRLAKARHVAGDPIGGPVEHGLDRYGRRAEQTLGAFRVRQPRSRRLFADDVRATAVSIETMLDWTADWVARDMASLGKATKFEV